jgi:hypothetical protein
MMELPEGEIDNVMEAPRFPPPSDALTLHRTLTLGSTLKLKFEFIHATTAKEVERKSLPRSPSNQR